MSRPIDFSPVLVIEVSRPVMRSRRSTKPVAALRFVFMPFSTEDLKLIAATGEVHIETRSGGRVYRTVIWVAVDDETVYVRSVRGGSGRWYQRVLEDPEAALDVDGTRLLVRAIPAQDPESVERASEGFRRKYPGSASLDAMLRPEVLHTTLRLEPAA